MALVELNRIIHELLDHLQVFKLLLSELVTIYQFVIDPQKFLLLIWCQMVESWVQLVVCDVRSHNLLQAIILFLLSL